LDTSPSVAVRRIEIGRLKGVRIVLKEIPELEKITLSVPMNWKPILIGVASVVLGVIQASSFHGDWLAAIKDRGVQTAIILGLLGLVTKQSNVTGGTVGQTPEAVARVATDPKPSTTP
jgi:hypothetical protein